MIKIISKILIFLASLLLIAGVAQAQLATRVNQGGTGWNAINSNNILFGDTSLRLGTSSALTFATSTSVLTVTAASTTRISNTGTAYFGATATSTFDSAGVLTLISALLVGSGGTGATSLTDGGVLLGSGTGAITPMAVLAGGEIIVGDGTTDPTTLTVGASSTVLTNNGSALAWTADPAFTSLRLTNPLTVGNGGTGLSTFTAAGRIPYSTGATTLAVLTAGASSTILTIDGTTPAWTASPAIADLRITTSLLAPSGFGGRSLTVSGSALDADNELYNNIVSFNVASSTMGTSTVTVAQHKFATAVTITRISCSTNRATSTIQFDERSEGTEETAGTDVIGSPALALSCGSGSDTSATTTFNNATIAADAILNFTIDDGQPTQLRPTILRVHVEYTKDD